MAILIKQNEGFDYSLFKAKIVDGVEQIPDEIKDKMLVVENSVVKDLDERKLMWKDGELVSNPEYTSYAAEVNMARENRRKEKRIAELKQLLAESDYRAIKYMEGLYTDAEYEPYKQERQAYRDEINRLESKLK